MSGEVSGEDALAGVGPSRRVLLNLAAARLEEVAAAATGGPWETGRVAEQCERAGVSPSRPLTEIGLSTRTCTMLGRAGVTAVGVLMRLSEGELRGLPGVAAGRVDEVRSVLAQWGLTLRSAPARRGRLPERDPLTWSEDRRELLTGEVRGRSVEDLADAMGVSVSSAEALRELLLRWDEDVRQAVDAQAGTSVEALGLSSRSMNCLRRSGIETVGDLLRLSEADLGDVRNMGSASMAEILGALRERGLTLHSGRAARSDGLDPRAAHSPASRRRAMDIAALRQSPIASS